MAIFYTLVGILNVLISKFNAKESTEFLHYFEYALTLDPTLDSAKYYIALIKLYSPGISSTQRRLVLKTLQTMIKRNSPDEDS